jgi:hypothetical protein
MRLENIGSAIREKTEMKFRQYGLMKRLVKRFRAMAG